MKELFNKYNSFIKFLLVGGCSTLIDFTIYIILGNFLLNWISKAISMTISSLFSFIVNRGWTFKSNDTSLYVKIKYIVAVIINISINTAINQYVYKLTNSKIIAFIMATGIAMIANYFMQKKLVFKEKNKDEIFNNNTML